MNPQLVIVLVIAMACGTGGFIGGWTLQSWRYGAKENERAQQELVDQRLAAATAVRRIDNVITAQNAAVVRERDLRAAIAGGRAALVGLSGAVDTTLRDASISLGACTDRAATLGGLFLDSERDYIETAAKAGRHASDVQTCHDATWPKQQQQQIGD